MMMMMKMHIAQRIGGGKLHTPWHKMEVGGQHYILENLLTAISEMQYKYHTILFSNVGVLCILLYTAPDTRTITDS
jgi:hypothetical protein